MISDAFAERHHAGTGECVGFEIIEEFAIGLAEPLVVLHRFFQRDAGIVQGIGPGRQNDGHTVRFFELKYFGESGDAFLIGLFGLRTFELHILRRQPLRKSFFPLLF